MTSYNSYFISGLNCDSKSDDRELLQKAISTIGQQQSTTSSTPVSQINIVKDQGPNITDFVKDDKVPVSSISISSTSLDIVKGQRAPISFSSSTPETVGASG